MNLGKTLVKELNLDPGVDTLARWMAHYIAEQIENAEHSIGAEKNVAEARCVDTILKIWSHRASFPGKARPFVNFEPILRTLKRLDPKDEHHFFFREPDEIPESLPDELSKWIEIAKGIDDAARVWLKYVFKQAAIVATDEASIEWLENSAALQERDNFSVLFRELHSDIDVWGDDMESQEIKREKISLYISKLEAFAELNQTLLDEYKNELKKLSLT